MCQRKRANELNNKIDQAICLYNEQIKYSEYMARAGTLIMRVSGKKERKKRERYRPNKDVSKVFKLYEHDERQEIENKNEIK